MILTLVTKPRLSDLEVVIEQNIGAAFEVGRALMVIRDEELYREAGFDGFVAYLNSKPWGIGQANAYRQIDAARVHDVISPIGEIAESHTRELAPLLKKATPDVIRHVYGEVLGEAGSVEKVTAAAIREKVREILPSKKIADRGRANVLDPEAPRNQQRASANRDRLSRVLAEINGSCDALSEFDVRLAMLGANSQEVSDWNRRITSAVRALRQLKTRLQEENNA